MELYEQTLSSVSFKGQKINQMNKELFGNNERPFKVPENYFDDFDARLMQKIEAEESFNKAKENALAPIISVIKPWLTMAAGFLLIALIYHQAPVLFKYNEQAAEILRPDDDFINSLAFIVDENDINELIADQESVVVFSTDSFFVGKFSEEELAALIYLE
jgi:hypothetical protein